VSELQLPKSKRRLEFLPVHSRLFRQFLQILVSLLPRLNLMLIMLVMNRSLRMGALFLHERHPLQILQLQKNQKNLHLLPGQPLRLKLRFLPTVLVPKSVTRNPRRRTMKILSTRLSLEPLLSMSLSFQQRTPFRTRLLETNGPRNVGRMLGMLQMSIMCSLIALILWYDLSFNLWLNLFLASQTWFTNPRLHPCTSTTTCYHLPGFQAQWRTSFS
jgi:hypothetical protein